MSFALSQNGRTCGFLYCNSAIATEPSMGSSGYRMDKIEPTPVAIEYPDGYSRGSAASKDPIASYRVYNHEQVEIASLHAFGNGDAPVAASEVANLLHGEPAENIGIVKRLADAPLAVYTAAAHMKNQVDNSEVVVSGVDARGAARAKLTQQNQRLDGSARQYQNVALLENQRQELYLNADQHLLRLGANIQGIVGEANLQINAVPARAGNHQNLLAGVNQVQLHLENHIANQNHDQEQAVQPLFLGWHGDEQPQAALGIDALMRFIRGGQ